MKMQKNIEIERIEKTHVFKTRSELGGGGGALERARSRADIGVPS